jgi:hypothetical protein
LPLLLQRFEIRRMMLRPTIRVVRDAMARATGRHRRHHRHTMKPAENQVVLGNPHPGRRAEIEDAHSNTGDFGDIDSLACPGSRARLPRPTN